METNDLFNADVLADAGELWAALIMTGGDKDWVLNLISAAAVKNPEKFVAVAGFALYLSMTQSWKTALDLLAEAGVDSDTVRQCVAEDAFKGALSAFGSALVPA